MFADHLESIVSQHQAPICMGIDPQAALFPEFLLENSEDSLMAQAEAAYTYFSNIFETTLDLVPVVKFQIAFFEAMGIAGLQVLSDLIKKVQGSNTLIILDGKRGDIGSTSKAYYDAYFSDSSDFASDAITISPYLGRDSIIPFFENKNYSQKGVFVLLKTSNDSASDIQNLRLEAGGTVCEHLAQHVFSWFQEYPSAKNQLGFVVGATHIDEGSIMRALLPDAWFLVPGIGHQGGNLQDVKQFSRDKKTFDGLLISNSRALTYAYRYNGTHGKDYQKAARNAIQDMIASMHVVSI